MIHQKHIYQLIAWSIEWEGSIEIEKQIRNNECTNYTTSIKISNTEIELLEEFKNIVKIGYINKKGYVSEDGSPKYYWRLMRKEVELYLPLILPYLIIKWQQAKLVIETNKILKTRKYVNTLPNYLRTLSELYTYEEVLILNDNWKECAYLNDQQENMKRKKLLKKGR